MAVLEILNSALADNLNMAGLRYISADSNMRQAGSVPDVDSDSSVTWLDNNLIMSYPVMRADVQMGLLIASFELDQLRAESTIFTDQLMSKETETRLSSYIMIGAGTLITLLLVGSIVWVIVRGQMARIRDLKVQAEKLRDADFGEPLPRPAANHHHFARLPR